MRFNSAAFGRLESKTKEGKKEQAKKKAFKYPSASQ